jgi:alkanesulfonate monooxygenase SsuD/methylene tetrahydromethanopterin reductase-like flavin-dependent oxidoreductase (luciferase family)
VFEEQVEIVARQLREDRFDFRGKHYTLLDCEARPKPVQERLPVIIGGSGGRRSVAIAARWADEYNTVFPSLDDARERREAVARACEAEGRDPLVFSMMIGCVIGADAAEVEDRARRLHERSGSDEAFDDWFAKRRGVWLVGTVDEVSERLAAYEEVGVERVMLQHLLHDDTDAVALLGELGAGEGGG